MATYLGGRVFVIINVPLTTGSITSGNQINYKAGRRISKRARVSNFGDIVIGASAPGMAVWAEIYKGGGGTVRPRILFDS